jgi:hypothetical protein
MSTFSYSTTIPAANNDPADDQPQMQTNFASISGLINVDHVGFNVIGGGEHEQVTFNANNVPAVPTSPPILFTNTVGAVPQLFFYSGSATTSSSQYVVAANGSTFLLGGIILKWGTLAAVANGATVTFPVPFPNACFGAFPTINIGSTVSPVGTNGFTATGFTFRTAAAGSVPITYLAIGY